MNDFFNLEDERMSNKVDAYTIYDIAKWQVDLEEKIIEEQTGGIQLPTLQRGFVWQPYQMEALWDSILRGYPIGSLLMSRDDNGTKFLLDGQQRCTTIALGFKNPLNSDRDNLLNLKKENIPAIWVDLKPSDANQHGLKYAVRVLTRSHPWGYQLNDHTKRLSMVEQKKALDSYKKKTGRDDLKFSQLDYKYRSPWEAHFPVPLALLLVTDERDFREVLESIPFNIDTKYGHCDYANVKDEWIEDIYKGVAKAKSLLLPEITVDKKNIEGDDNSLETQEKKLEDAVLFLRLNASGTNISGQELIYSLIKAMLPEAKKLVEDIGFSFLSPTTVVNLFVRFVQMERKDFASYERTIGLPEFRKLLTQEDFKKRLKEFIESEEAKKLMNTAVNILNSHPSELPPIFIKEVLSKNTELLLVLMVFIYKKQSLDEFEKMSVRNAFIHNTLYSGSKEKSKLAPKFYRILSTNQWQDWGENWTKVIYENHDLLPPLLSKNVFGDFLRVVLKRCIEDRNPYLTWFDWLKKVMSDNESFVDRFPIPYNTTDDVDDLLVKEQKIDQAVNYWTNLCNYVFRNRQFLIICQRAYFNDKFEEYMAFDGIEDTNKPWDWDHIYPYSWAYRKRNIDEIVKWLLNTNGNLRALSFDDNRSQGNSLSPETRFKDFPEAQKESFICETDLPFWLKLTDENYRLLKGNTGVDDFVNAVLLRMLNIYNDSYDVILEKNEEL